MDIINRYFTKYDSSINKLGTYKIDELSNKIEYKFASDYLKKNDDILIIEDDNFSQYAEKKVKSCNTSLYLSLQYKKKFDKIFCISKLSTLKMSQQERLMYDMIQSLKMNGKIIFTDIHPNLNINRFLRLVDEAGLKFSGEVDYDKTVDDILRCDMVGVLFYRAVLSKHKDNIETNPIEMEYKSKTL